MGRILIDTRDIRDAARDLRGGVGAISEARANVNSVFRGSWLGPNGQGFQSRWDQELAIISQVGNEVERIAGDLDGYASRVDSEQRLGSQIRGVAGWTLRTGKSLFSRVWNALKAGWNSIMSFLTRISQLIREAMAFIARGLARFIKLRPGQSMLLFSTFFVLFPQIFAPVLAGGLLERLKAAWLKFMEPKAPPTSGVRPTPSVPPPAPVVAAPTIPPQNQKILDQLSKYADGVKVLDGECFMLMHQVVKDAGGPAVWGAGGNFGYDEVYRHYGFSEVPEAAALPGDIIQWFDPSNSKTGETGCIHTAILLSGTPPGPVTIVEQNSPWGQGVARNTYSTLAGHMPPGAAYLIFRAPAPTS